MIPLHTAQLIPLDPTNPAHVRAMVEIWNFACGEALAISERFAAFNLRAAPRVTQRGWLLVDDNWAQAFVVASFVDGYPALAAPSHGWIDALVVAPAAQRQGAGRRLLATAEQWLREHGRTHIAIGGSLRPFAPGVPEELGTTSFFVRHGYSDLGAGDEPEVAYDVAADLSEYRPPAALRQLPAAARPAQRGQEDLLLDFLRAEFPGRWQYEAEVFLQVDGGRIGDYMLLWTEVGVQGACVLTFPDSVRPIERYYPYSLPKPWGQLGSIGVSAALRGQGYGSHLLDAGLRRLHDNGINGCVIDWTNLLNFYGGFGFEPLRRYAMFAKTGSST
jgi:GNAT superfamily N-acetyltransferase